MKTIDELRARKRELLERKEEELRAKAEGRGDNMALFILEEELLAINDHIRALDPRRKTAPRSRVTNHSRAADYQQYRNWLVADGGDNREELATMSRAVEDSDLYLTRKQQEVFDLWRSGVGVTAIAAHVGVDKSTVSRTLAAAKRSIREAVELEELPVREHAVRLDLSDGATANVVLSCVTGKQAVYLYLYYGEGLSLREISALVGVDHSAVSKALQRGLGAISKTLRYREAVLDNMEVLGDLAYELYEEGFEPREKPGTLVKGPGWAGKALGKKPKARRQPAARPSVTVRAERSKPEKAGKLLVALKQREGLHRLGQWLEALFANITKSARMSRRTRERKKSKCSMESTGKSTA